MRALGQGPIRFTFGVFAAAAVAAVLLLMSSGPTTTEATCLLPTVDPCVENSTDYTYSASVASAAPGADRTLTTVYSVPDAIVDPNDWGNINFGALTTFDPAATVMQGCNRTPNGSGFATTNSAGGDCLTAGGSVGTLVSDTTLGTLGSLCFLTFAITFNFYSVALPSFLDSADAPVADVYDSWNLAYTQPQGSDNRFERWGANTAIGVGGGAVIDKVGPEATNDNVFIKNYPKFLLDVFQDAGGTPVIPLALYGSETFVAGSTDVMLYLAIFDEGQLASEFSPPNPAGRATSNLGFASATILQDPSAFSASPSSISAFCATTSTTVLNGTVGGKSRATNPAAGTHFNLAWAASQRDLDNDGVENALDTCVTQKNTGGSPRKSGNNPDGDMLDAVCDTVANGFLGPATSDGTQSTDAGWYNTQDTCPMITNPAQGSAEISVAGSIAKAYAAGVADDGGPVSDGIGDECDSEIGAKVYTYNDLATTITPSDTVANGRWAARGMVAPICYGSPPDDADGDGYCASDTDAFDGNVGQNALKHNAWTTDSDIKGVLGTTGTLGSGSWDTDSAGSDPLIGGDGVGDFGYDSDWLETYLGTDARQACSLSSTLSDEPLDAWIFDTNDDGKATLGDVLAIAPVWLQVATTPAHKRFDWNGDGSVGLSDVLSIAPVWLKKCVPIVQPQ